METLTSVGRIHRSVGGQLGDVDDDLGSRTEARRRRLLRKTSHELGRRVGGHSQNAGHQVRRPATTQLRSPP